MKNKDCLIFSFTPRYLEMKHFEFIYVKIISKDIIELCQT